MFIVVPQFLVTGLSSIVFAMLDPDKSVLHARRPDNTPSPQAAARGVVAHALSETRPDSIVVIFRYVAPTVSLYRPC